MSGPPRGGVHVLLPNDIDDPATPSGGNTYDRRVVDGLAELGWSVRAHAVWDDWPVPSSAALAGALGALPDGALVVVDGLLASAVPVAEARRLRLVVLLHMSFPGQDEVLSAAAAVVTTSEWSRRRLRGVDAAVARPGADPAPLATPGPAGDRLLCVAAVMPHKGHDVLVDALAMLGDLTWRCVCVGSLDRDRGFADMVRRSTPATFTGPLTGAALDAAYATADLLVVPSRDESYGMVVTEALARGVPVVASDVGGLPEALGHAPDDTRPGLLVPPGDPAALAGALRRWLTTPALRDKIRQSALMRRTTLTGWPTTATLVSDVLSTVARHESTSR